MDLFVNILIVIAAYIYAAFPVLYLLGKMRGFDLRHEEDMHSALWHKVGRVEGFIGVTWDVTKGGIAVALVGYVFHLGEGMMAAVGVATVVGRMWSIFLDWRGEKANTTSLGVHMALAVTAWYFLLGPILIGAAIRTLPRLLDRSQSASERLKFGGPPSMSLPFGMLAGFALFPLGCWLLNEPWQTVAAGGVIFGLIVLKRITPDLGRDLKIYGNKRSVILNRILLDRSWFRLPQCPNGTEVEAEAGLP